MKKILTAVIAATMLVPSMTLASSIRPGSVPRPRSKTPLCLDAEDKFTEKCEIVIDETGVTGPVGHITDVVKWSTTEKEFNVAGGIVGGVAGAGVGAAAGMTTCMFTVSYTHLTLPTNREV